MRHERYEYQMVQLPKVDAPDWTIESDHEADKRLRGEKDNGGLAEPGLRQQS